MTNSELGIQKGGGTKGTEFMNHLILFSASVKSLCALCNESDTAASRRVKLRLALTSLICTITAMPSPAYKGASQQTGLFYLLSFVSVAAFLTVIMISIHLKWENVLGAWTLVPSLATLIGGLAVAFVVTSRRNRQRIQRVAAWLEGNGYEVTVKPTEASRADFAAPLAHLLPSLDLRNGPTGIQWFAVQRTSSVRLFEHLYTTGSGKTYQEHYHTVIAWPAGHPELGSSGLASAPWLFMAQYNRFLRRDVRKRELQLPEFADIAERWSILGDAATAARFLKPAVRAQLDNSPKQETWCMGAGWVCCSFKGVVDVSHLERFLAHARSTLAAAG